jgi:hypothetical protein
MTTEQIADELRARIEAQGTVMIGGKPHFVVEWDRLIPPDQLGSYVIERAKQLTAPPPEAPADRLTSATTPGGKILRWRPGLELSYAVLKATFITSGLYDLVRANIFQAARDWERICGVKLIYLEQLDDGVRANGLTPTFTVQEFQQPSVYALAFLPDAQPVERVIFVDAIYLGADHDKVGIMRHELGHVLGFRHEHVRAENPGGPVPEELATLIRPLGPFDPHSVMNYPPEGEAGSFVLTEYDRRGAEFVYGGPLNLFENRE